MIRPAIYFLIVIFWLTMTGLLLRNEVRPGESALREVPTSHVIKLILHHQQRSDLNIAMDKMPPGHLRIDPRIDKEDGLRVIAFTGHLAFIVPGADRQRVAWDGEVEMNKDLVIQRFRLGVTAHGPTATERDKLRSEVVVVPSENIAHYELSTAKGVVEKQDFTLDENGAREVFRQLGIDPAMLPVAAPIHMKPPVIKAQQSSIKIHGERMETYLVTVESNGQTWLECHVNQVGQIVRATTMLGYTLAPDDITP